MEKFVDVRRLIKSKNKKLLKWLPPFVISWIERIIHQDEVNAFMLSQKDSDEFEFCAATVKEFELDLNITGMEHLPELNDSCIFVSNHPLGGLDAIAIIHLFRSKRPDIKFIVNDLLMNVTSLKNKFIGVNKVGRSAKESLQKVEEQFSSSEATFLFPAGLVSRKKGGKVKDLEWKKTFITKAKKYQKPIVPVYIDGCLTKRFYRLANIRSFLGVRINIEMFFLVDELFKQKGRTIPIAVGQPIDPSVFSTEKNDWEWAQWVKEKVYNLNMV